MPHELALRDHRALQHAVARTAVAGVAAGLLQLLHPGPLGDAACLFALGAAAVPPRTLRSTATAGALACAAAGGAALGGVGGAAALGLGASLMYARDLAGAGRRLLSCAAGAMALLAASFVHFGVRDGLDGAVSPAVAMFVSGGAAGLLAGFGVLGRLVQVAPASPLPPAPALPPESPELRELLGRAREATGQIEHALGRDEPRAARAARDVLDRVVGLGARWSEIERQLAGDECVALRARRDGLVERARAAEDDVARAEYLRAERALAQQIEDLEAIRGWQQRALARLHHHVAVLERLRLAALHRRSAESAGGGEELQPLIEELSAAGFDLDGAAEALAELPA